VKPLLADPATWLATWFGVGLLPGPQGTWASLAALPFAALFLSWGGAFVLLMATALIALVGIWASDRVAARMRIEDPGAIVIDEVAGQWLALAILAAAGTADWMGYGLAFVLFRAADIVKPWPVSWAERALPGGLGVMADDLVAGIYAGALAAALRAWL